MTMKAYILGRSYLPKDGTHTMKEHAQAMVMESYGVCIDIDVANDEIEDVAVILESMDIIADNESTDILVSDDSESVIVYNDEIKIEVENNGN